MADSQKATIISKAGRIPLFDVSSYLVCTLLTVIKQETSFDTAYKLSKAISNKKPKASPPRDRHHQLSEIVIIIIIIIMCLEVPVLCLRCCYILVIPLLTYFIDIWQCKEGIVAQLTHEKERTPINVNKPVWRLCDLYRSTVITHPQNYTEKNRW